MTKFKFTLLAVALVCAWWFGYVVARDVYGHKLKAEMLKAEVAHVNSLSSPGGSMGNRLDWVMSLAGGIGSSNMFLIFCAERDGQWVGAMIQSTNEVSVFEMGGPPQFGPAVRRRKLGGTL